MSSTLSSLDLIAAFEAVMAKGSLSAAARYLNRSQPTVRRQIEALEAELAVVLFTRSANGLDPTELAVSLFPQAKNIIYGTYAFARSAGDSADKVEGTVRITCSRIFATWLMPDILMALTTEHTGLCIELVAEDQVENLLRREADIAVRLVQPCQNAIVSRKVSPRYLGLFVAPEFRDTDGGNGDMADHLARTPFVWEDRDDLLSRGLRQLELPLPSRIAVKTDDQSAQISHIRAGVGAGICQLEIAESLGLRRVAKDWSYVMPVWVAMHEDQSKILRVRTVFDALVAGFTGRSGRCAG